MVTAASPPPRLWAAAGGVARSQQPGEQHAVHRNGIEDRHDNSGPLSQRGGPAEPGAGLRVHQQAHLEVLGRCLSHAPLRTQTEPGSRTGRLPLLGSKRRRARLRLAGPQPLLAGRLHGSSEQRAPPPLSRVTAHLQGPPPRVDSGHWRSPVGHVPRRIEGEVATVGGAADHNQGVSRAGLSLPHAVLTDPTGETVHAARQVVGDLNRDEVAAGVRRVRHDHEGCLTLLPVLVC